jgi:hypothetical protein
MGFDPSRRQGTRMIELSGLLEILGCGLSSYCGSVEEGNAH